MRIIKFRAWHFKKPIYMKTPQMEYDVHDACDINSSSTHLSDFGRYVNEHNTGRLILMQFTGLFDKNGKEIYENDVVMFCIFPNTLKIKGVITYYPNLMYFAFKIADGSHFTILDLAVPEQKEVEVIGNIYENPELLEGLK